MRRLAATVLALLVIPVSAMARMDSLSMEDMEEVNGQTGFSVDLKWQLEDSYLAWTDDDGFEYTTGSTIYQHTGVLTLDGLKIDNGAATPGPVTITGISLDVGSTASNVSYWRIGLPQVSGRITVDNLRVGNQQAQGGRLAKLYLGDLDFASSTIRIQAH